MSKIDNLIKKYCPNGVEYKKIKEICIITRGRVISKSYLTDNAGEYPVYSSQTLNNGVFGNISTYDFNGEYVQWTTDGANAGTVFFRKGKFSVTNVCGLLKVKEGYIKKINTYYLALALDIISKNYVNYSTSNPKLMSNVIAEIKIPIPPLPVQDEIVNILDKFVKLEAELEAELEARKVQYEFYREKLLNDKNFELIEVGSKFKILRGKRLTKSQLSDTEKYPVFHGGLHPLGNYNYSNRLANTVMIINVGASAGTVGFSKVDFWSSDGCYCFEKSPLIIDKYLYYALICKEKELISKIRYAGIPTLDAKVIEKLKIPVPPLKEQERIVSILDRFDKLINDISEGLPAEIEARRKQYEYYRNKLLSFEELSYE